MVRVEDFHAVDLGSNPGGFFNSGQSVVKTSDLS